MGPAAPTAKFGFDAVETVAKPAAAMVSCVALIQSSERTTREMHSSSIRLLNGQDPVLLSEVLRLLSQRGRALL